jgi:hypothetical protein
MTIKMKKTISLIAIMALMLCTIVLEAQVVKQPRPGATGSWRLLGTVQANFSADHDKIVVAGPYDYFRRLKFKVTGAGINMIRMIVTYDGGGTPEKIDLRFDIPEGGESRIIDLKGGRRKLRTVEFWYDTKGIFQGKANLTLFGIK